MIERSNQKLGTIEIFCKAAELGSYARAAEILGVNPSAVSKAVSRLETRFGTKLFHRTTRSLRLTEEGKIYFERCYQALQDIEEAENLVMQGLNKPQGLLRVTVPTAYGICVVIPRLHEFLSQYPEIKLELDVSDRLVDLIEENIDVAVRVGALTDSSLQMRFLGKYKALTVASPDYLKRYGIPKTITELHSHNCIQLVIPRTGQAMKWTYQVDGKLVDADVSGTFLTTLPNAACVMAANGIGIARLIEFVVREDIVRGSLVKILQNFEAPERNVFALYKSRLAPSSKVSAFLNFLTQLS